MYSPCAANDCVRLTVAEGHTVYPAAACLVQSQMHDHQVILFAVYVLG